MTAVPNDILTVKLDGKERELFMSFGLLNELLAEIGDLVRVGLIGVEQELRSNVLRIVLSERNEKGVISEELNLFAIKLSTADVHRILTWVSEHTLGFFLDAIETATKAHEPHLDRLKAPTLTPSGPGSDS